MGVCGCCALPSREGLGMGGLHSSRSSEPVSRPTALKIPPHVPLAHRRGLAGGSAVGRLAHALPPQRGSKPCGGCDSLPGATAAASEPSNDAKLGGTAAGVTRSGPKGQRLARRSSRAEHFNAFSASAARHRAWRVLGGRSGRCAARGAAACMRRRSVRQAGLVQAQREGSKARAIPGRGNGPLAPAIPATPATSW